MVGHFLILHQHHLPLQFSKNFLWQTNECDKMRSNIVINETLFYGKISINNQYLKIRFLHKGDDILVGLETKSCVLSNNFGPAWIVLWMPIFRYSREKSKVFAVWDEIKFCRTNNFFRLTMVDYLIQIIWTYRNPSKRIEIN